LGSVIEIGVEIGDSCQVGALSFVPKHARLEGGAIYAGIPAQRIGPATDAQKGGNTVCQTRTICDSSKKRGAVCRRPPWCS
jgi:carbonic anhydrase/acetyltransferase-like protein (isoleucine patch superfamily)